MLFIQGTRDPLAELTLITDVTKNLGTRARLHVVQDGDHSFKVLKRTDRTAAQVTDDLAATIAGWGGELR
jgi:predicted alpha/beta-hydrolase family hydrolase